MRKNNEAWRVFRQCPIGTVVKVTREMTNVGEGDQREWVGAEVPEYIGCVAGATWLCEGRKETIRYPARQTPDGPQPPEWETYLNVRKKIPVFIVRRSMFDGGRRVPVDGISVADEPLDDFPVAALFSSQIDRDELRRRMARVARRQPRDKKGRFIRATKRRAS